MSEEEKILDIKVRYEDAINGISKYKQQIEELNASMKDLKARYEDGAISGEEYRTEVTAMEQVVKEYKGNINTLSKEIQNNMKQEEEQEGSLRSLRAELSNLTKEYDSLSRAEREGASGQELQKHINDVTTELKEAEEATQRYYRNVGNYENAIQNALGANSKWLQGLTSIKETVDGGVVNAMKNGASAVSAFGKQLLALLANPIVAILAAIAAAIMLVIKGIQSSEENTQRLNAIMAPFQRVLQFVLNIIQELAGAILSVVEAGGKMANWMASQLEKWPLIGGKIKEVNDALRENIRLEQQKYDLEQKSRTYEVQNAKDALDVAKLRNQVKDTEHYTAQERLRMLERANKLEEEQMKRNVELAKQKLQILQAEAEQSQNDKAMNDAIAAAEAAVYNAQREYYQGTVRLKSQMNTTRQEILNENKKAGVQGVSDAKAAAEAKAAAVSEAERKSREEIRKAEDLLTQAVEQTYEQRRQVVIRTYDRQIEDIKVRLEKEKNLTIEARQAMTNQIVALEQIKNKQLDELSSTNLTEEITREQRRIEMKLSIIEKGTVEEYSIRAKQIQNEQVLAEEAANRENVSEEERLQNLILIRQKYGKQLDDLYAEQQNAIIQKQQEAIEQEYRIKMLEAETAENNQMAEIEQLRLRLEEKQALMDAARQMEGEADEAFYERQLQLKADYNNAKKALNDKEVEIEQTKMAAVADIYKGLASVAEAFGEKNKALAVMSKVLALGEITVNTGKAIAAGVAQAQSVPFPGNIAAVATTVATVLANIATAIKTVNSAKFATGGAVWGSGTATSDSIPARLSNGESVLNAAATSMFAPALSAMNQLGGGVPIVISGGRTEMGEEMLANAFAKGMARGPKPIVSVEEINTVQDRVKTVENFGAV